jgi:DNA-binding transcriptional ArsR family regulator
LNVNFSIVALLTIQPKFQHKGVIVVFRKTQEKPSTFLRKRKPRRRNNNSNSRATTVLKAMSNSQRLEILSHLLDGKERSVKELERILKTLSQSALSQHLGRLRRASILKTRRDSQTIYYSIKDEEVKRIMALLIDIYPDDSSLP